MLEEIGIDDLEAIYMGQRNITLSKDQEEVITNSFNYLSSFSKNKVIYGINTGFGPMAQYRIKDEEIEQLQYNLIHSHANGSNQYIGPDEIRLTLVCRLNSLSLGYSGVSLEFIKTIEKFLNNNVLPCVPEHGGVGASGDLVQLAHIAYTLIGHGKVYYKGKITNTQQALKEAGIQPANLKLRDGLAAINGTSCMTGVSAMNLIKSRRLISWSIQASSIMNELTASYDDSFSKELNEAKRHSGQKEVAQLMRTLLADGKVLKQRMSHLFDGESIKGKEYFSEKVQEYYSLRCVPQIIGPVLDAWKYAKQTIEDEVNSANDNPIVCTETNNVYHGGNFHGDYISYEMDKIKIGITKLTMLIERQLNYLMNSKLNQKFPPFLNAGKLGFNFGIQGMQFTAVSTTAENQTLSNPMSIHSISNNGDNQDIVSMGTNAALMTKKVIDNAFEVLSIHMIAIAQAIDLNDNIDQLSTSTKEFYNFVREEVPFLTEDISLHKQLANLQNKLLTTQRKLF